MGFIDSLREAEWDLENCCEVEEQLFLILYGVYAILFLCLSHWTMFKPMRLFAVFIHEFGHASACMLTGGKVDKIEVHNNEGGVTGYRGGCRAIVIPSGYVGAAFFGGVFVALSGTRISATVCAGLIIFFLLLALCLTPNKIVCGLSIGFTALFGILLFIEWFVYDPVLEYVTLFFGVFLGFYSVKDIYDDLIKRTADGSDAESCHKIIPCCLPKCVGLQWGLCALICSFAGLYIAMVTMLTNNN